MRTALSNSNRVKFSRIRRTIYQKYRHVPSYISPFTP